MAFQKIIQDLLDKGISRVNISYSGSGDSGAIDHISYIDSQEEEQEIESKYNDDIEKVVYPLLEDIEDWYNNEGGEGIVVLNLKEKTYTINNNIRYIHYEEYKHSGNFTQLID